MKTDIEQLKELVKDSDDLLGRPNTRPALERVIKRYKEMEEALNRIKETNIYSVSSKNKTNKDEFLRENVDNPLCRYTYLGKFGALAKQALELSDEERGEN